MYFLQLSTSVQSFAPPPLPPKMFLHPPQYLFLIPPLPPPLSQFCHSKSRHPNLYYYSIFRHSYFYLPGTYQSSLDSSHKMCLIFYPSTVSSTTSASSSAPQTSPLLPQIRKLLFLRPSTIKKLSRIFRTNLIITQDNIPTHPSSSPSAQSLYTQNDHRHPSILRLMSPPIPLPSTLSKHIVFFHLRYV